MNLNLIFVSLVYPSNQGMHNSGVNLIRVYICVCVTVCSDLILLATCCASASTLWCRQRHPPRNVCLHVSQVISNAELRAAVFLDLSLPVSPVPCDTVTLRMHREETREGLRKGRREEKIRGTAGISQFPPLLLLTSQFPNIKASIWHFVKTCLFLDSICLRCVAHPLFLLLFWYKKNKHTDWVILVGLFCNAQENVAVIWSDDVVCHELFVIESHPSVTWHFIIYKLSSIRQNCSQLIPAMTTFSYMTHISAVVKTDGLSAVQGNTMISFIVFNKWDFAKGMQIKALCCKFNKIL